MNKLTYAFLTLFAVSLLVACSSNTSREITPELTEANEYLQKSLDIREDLMETEKQLKAAEIDYSELKDELKIWDKDIIEVPGFEHSHDDEHQRAYHVHNAMKPFSDVEHLNYQKVMYEEIADLSERMKKLMENEITDK
ncbi:hypothetical protein [Aquiflexum lacus]|uniref:hypothetical protein n=1 Tax=Aquiflexum lacus TaxID=2483805 RepID=UPI001895BD9E|nr:hypothetical protein [Aquiflexum lacus]